MTDEIKNSRQTDQADAELTTADLAGTSQKTPRALNESPIETESQPVGSAVSISTDPRSIVVVIVFPVVLKTVTPALIDGLPVRGSVPS